MEEGSEEQFQVETVTLAQCSSAVKKVQETGKYTEEAIMPICSSLVRSSKCDFFSEALSLATSHTDFNSKVFCKNIGEAHFCSQTMDRLLTSPIMSDLAFGACMRDKSARGEQYCQRFSKMHAYAVQHDDLDTMRACYMIEAYDDSDREESNSKKQDHEEPNSKKPDHEEEASSNLKKSNASNANSTHTKAAVVKPHANVSLAAANQTVAAKDASKHSVTAEKVTKQHATAQSYGQTKVHAAVSKQHATKKAAAVTAKDTSARKDAHVITKGASAKKDALIKNATAQKAETSLVSSLIHTLSATVAGVAHVVAKVLPVPPPLHVNTAKNATTSVAQTIKAPGTKKTSTEVPVASTSKGASLTQAKKVSVKQTSHSNGKNAKAANTAAAMKHSVEHKSVASKHHIQVAKSAASTKAKGTPVVKQHTAALMGKHASSQKTTIKTKGSTEELKKTKKGTKTREGKDEKGGKYGGFLSGFISL